MSVEMCELHITKYDGKRNEWLERKANVKHITILGGVGIRGGGHGQANFRLNIRFKSLLFL